MGGGMGQDSKQYHVHFKEETCFSQADALPSISKEQLNALLEEYMQSQRTISRLVLPTSEGLSFDGMSPGFDQSENSTQDPKNDLLDDTHGVGMLRKQEVGETMDEDACSKETVETADCNASKALVESHLAGEPMAEEKENDDQEVQQERLRTSNSAGYFMSIALSTDKPEKPSFLDDPFYCIGMHNELSTDVDIPGIPLKTGEAPDFLLAGSQPGKSIPISNSLFVHSRSHM